MHIRNAKDLHSGTSRTENNTQETLKFLLFSPYFLDFFSVLALPLQTETPNRVLRFPIKTTDIRVIPYPKLLYIMKRYILLFIVGIVSSISALGMNLRDAQAQAYFLSDKMAYELNLTPQQYDLVYQVNLEYFLNVNSARDLDGVWWNYRNTDLSYILYDWQWQVYRAADYFIRPLRWVRGAWYCSLWDHYHRDYFFFHRPTVFASWHGGLWHGRHHKSPSPFIGHRPHTHHGGMNPNYGKPGKPGYQGHHPGGGDRRPGGNNGYRPDNKGNRPGHSDGRPGGNNGYRPDNKGNRPGNSDGRPGGNSGYRPDNKGNQSGNSGYRPSNSNRNNSSRGGNVSTSSRSGRTQQSATPRSDRSFSGGRSSR